MAREFDSLLSRLRPQYTSPQEEINRRFPGPFDFLPGQSGVGEAPSPIRPGRQERFGDPTKVISQQLPPSLGSAERVRTQDAIPSGSPEQVGTGAGTLPSGLIDTIQRLLMEQRRRQGGLAGLPQYAGDVLPFPRGTAQGSYDRQLAIDPMRGMAGQHSINTAGGRQSPYLDLMDILQFPSGQPYPRR